MKNQQIPYVLVDRRSELEQVTAGLRKETAIGVDLEADSLFHYQEKVCLLQISAPSQNILIDTLALRDLSPLVPIFSDPGIRKIFHGADYDIRSLYRDFGIEVNSLFDTQIAAVFLGIKEPGLANLLKKRLGITVEKKYQKKDWSARPLPKPMLEYAALDAVHLLSLAHMLEEELRPKGRLFCFEEECERLSKVRATQSDCSHFFLKFKGAGRLDPRSLTVLEKVLRFRDGMAKKLDRPPFKVFGNAQVMKMVREKPRTLNELKEKECLSPKQIKGFGRALSKKIDKALNLPKDLLLIYPKKAGRRIGPKEAKRVKALKQWREKRASELDVDPALVCSNSRIQSLAVMQPRVPNDLEGISEMRNWQRKVFGNEICSILKALEK
ncbi:MAG: HRDC domain-containing protein [Deltaproteobacteria bacterium]|nr:HRDC domain-containing protein [Deltaproteobacteria bacterium]